MAHIKTAISIDRALFEQVNDLAQKLDVSRSYLFVLAVEEFLRRYENQELLQQINQAYDDLPTAEEEQLLAGMRHRLLRLVQRER